MKILIIFTIFTAFGLISPVLANQGIITSVSLSPAGSFEVRSPRIRGAATKNGDGSLSARQLRVSVNSLVTGIELRDEHLRDKLKASEYSDIIVSNAQGESGRGSADLNIAGVQRKIAFTYTERGSVVEVDFHINLRDFSISGISYMGVGVRDQVRVKAYVPLR